MNVAAVCTVANFNITIVYRMVQRQPPFKIRMQKIRQYDRPFGVSLVGLKWLFLLISLYIGFPISRIKSPVLVIGYLLYWYLTIYWWYYFSMCHFRNCIYIGNATSVILLLYTFLGMMEWIPLLVWSVYTLYISIWYNMSYAKTNFILS